MKNSRLEHKLKKYIKNSTFGEKSLYNDTLIKEMDGVSIYLSGIHFYTKASIYKAVKGKRIYWFEYNRRSAPNVPDLKIDRLVTRFRGAANRTYRAKKRDYGFVEYEKMPKVVHGKNWTTRSKRSKRGVVYQKTSALMAYVGQHRQHSSRMRALVRSYMVEKLSHMSSVMCFRYSNVAHWSVLYYNTELPDQDVVIAYLIDFVNGKKHNLTDMFDVDLVINPEWKISL